MKGAQVLASVQPVVVVVEYRMALVLKVKHPDVNRRQLAMMSDEETSFFLQVKTLTSSGG